ncbi:TPA: hypothetical protein R4352_002063, partial [Pasteurella multocida]|nr:hypothetical protein [Pasteurella multocida]
LLDALNCQGKKIVFNLWNNEINKIYSRLNADIIFIIYDTDKTQNYNRFNNNLNFLKKNKIKFFLLQQTNNLEDELVYCTSCSKIEDFFGNSTSEFKASFISCGNLQQKLNRLHFNPEKLWSRNLHQLLLSWSGYRGNYKDLNRYKIPSKS